jgi:hypothetical protein
VATLKTPKYANPERLADVLALIQVLALGEHTRRSEEGLKLNLQGTPRTANQWSDLARQHPEFFRVRDVVTEDEKGRADDERHRVSLLARHVLPEDKELPVEYVGKLLDSAILLHDRELSRSQRLKEVILPLMIALIGAIAVVIASRVAELPPKSATPTAATDQVDSVAFDQVKLLADYTIFHIGLYATLASALIALVTSDLGSRIRLKPALLWSAVIGIAIAGLAGGVIASSLPHFRSLPAFMSEPIGPYRSGLMPGELWTYLEHTAFWFGIASIVLAFAWRDPA